MPPKKKEDPAELPSDVFRFADGSVYRGNYTLHHEPSLDGTLGSQAAAAVPTPAKKHGSLAGSRQSAASVDGTMHGYGCFEDASSARYEGEWQNGSMDGLGTLYLPSGAVYTGDFAQHTFHGTGRYTWADGSYYEGEWSHNRMHGLGVYVDRAGKRWHGNFTNGDAAELVVKVVL